MRFRYYDGEHNGTVSAAPGSLSDITVVNDETCDATATITNVNATSVRVSSSFQSDRQKGPTIDEVTIYYEGKYANTLTASAVKATQTFTFKTKAQNLSKASVFNVTGAQGAVTFSKKSGNAGITVSADGKVTVKKSLAAGTYKAVFTVKAAGDATHDEATKDVAVNFVIGKAKNTLTAKAVTRKAKASKVAKKAVTVARPIKVTKQQGKLKYAKVKKGSSKYLSVNKKNGKVTVKKGTPKGTYKIKIKVAAAGNSNYKAGSKTVTCKIKVA